MSTTQRMTLIGLNEYTDGHIWDNFDLGLSEDFTTGLINAIMLEHGEKCVLYSDPDFMAQAIGLWCYKWQEDIQRMSDAIYSEYNPIHNYDRTEEYQDNEGVRSVSKTDAGHKATDSPDYTLAQTVDGNSEHKVSADNDSNYQPESKDITNAGTMKTSGKTQDLSETSNSKTNDQTTRDFKHNAHLFGNIGVQTTQSMIAEETRLRMTHNIMDIIGRLFANELLINIY